MVRTGRKSAQETARKRKTLNVALVLGGALALTAVAALVFLRPAPPAPLAAEDDPSLGALDAPVVVYYFADFQCPFCRRFEAGGMEDLRGRALAGELRLVFKDFPILGDDSWTAARASEHVWATAPGSYWSWHAAVFAAQGPERSGWASASRLVELTRAQVPEVDADALAEALASSAYLEEVRADKRVGEGVGVRSTPTLVIGDRVLNANDAEAVDAAIAEAGGKP